MQHLAYFLRMKASFAKCLHIKWRSCNVLASEKQECCIFLLQFLLSILQPIHFENTGQVGSELFSDMIFLYSVLVLRNCGFLFSFFSQLCYCASSLEFFDPNLKKRKQKSSSNYCRLFCMVR